MSEDQAISKRSNLLGHDGSSSNLVPIYIVCENPKKTLDLFFNDYLKVEAAGGMVKRKAKFLFIKRNGVWDLPKGKIESGERPKEAALREVEEECGIRCSKTCDLVGTTYHVYDCYGANTLKKTYWYAMTYPGDKKTVPQQEEGITKIAWVKEKKALKLREKIYPSLVDVLNTYFNV